MSSDLTTAKEHIDAVAQGAHFIHNQLKSNPAIEPDKFLELMRHIHGSLDRLAGAVARLERSR